MTELYARIEAAKMGTVTALDALLPRDRQGRGWICPRCKNGTGENGDGLRLWRGTKAKCFRCGWGGDILDVAGEVLGLTSIFQKLEAVEALAGTGCVTSPMKQKSPPKRPRDYTAYFRKAHAQVNETTYFAERALSTEIVERFNLGFVPSFYAGENLWWAAAIIPNGPSSYTARNTDPAADKANRYRKRGEAPIYNLAALYGAKPCFICEGEFDCLSIIEAGGAAVALGSAADWAKLITQVDEKKPSVPLLVALDNDEAGQAATVELMEALAARNVPCKAANLCRPGRDANDELRSDKARLTELIKNIETEESR